jgi:hypothetical protein
MAPVLGTDPRIAEFLRALGIQKPETTGRIIIDLPIDGVACVYVTRVADSDGFDLRFAEGDFQIVAVPKREVSPGAIDVTMRENDGYRRFAPTPQD